jgi:hypothetical protein
LLRGRSAEELDAFLTSEGDDETKGHIRRIREGGLTGLLSKQTMKAVLGGQSIEIDVDQLAHQLVTNRGPVMEFFNRMCAGSLLVLSWENSLPYHSPDPMWQFLRPCRHAAAHNRRFTFQGQEPRQPAEWRSVRIDRSLQGQRLFHELPAGGFMGPSDVLYLLSDLEGLIP